MMRKVYAHLQGKCVCMCVTLCGQRLAAKVDPIVKTIFQSI